MPLHAFLDHHAFSQAEMFFDSGFYDEAITEYKRFLCFNQDFMSDAVAEAYYRIGICYRNVANWDRAEKYLIKSIYNSTDVERKDKRRISLAVVQIANGKFNSARFGLVKLSMFSKHKNISNRANLMLGLCYLREYNWPESRSAFENYFQNETEPLIQAKKEKVMGVFGNINRIKYKSSKTAKWLSTFIPGAGQIYAGKVFDGLNALILNIATGAIVFNNLKYKAYHEALINFIVLFNRFYSGNRHNAKQMVEKYNEKLNRRVVSKILSILKEE